MGLHGQPIVNVDGSTDVTITGGTASTIFDFGAVTVTTTATQIRALNTKRNSLLISNNGSKTIFIGDTNAVTASTGFPLAKGDVIEFSGGDLYTGVVFGIIASGASVDVRFIELED